MVSPTPNGPQQSDLEYQYYYGWNYFTFGSTTGAHAALTTAVAVTTLPGRFGGFLSIINLNSAPAYIQVFDSTATITLGTTIPNIVIPVPAAATSANGMVYGALPISIPIVNGIQVAATTVSNGGTAISTGLTGTLLYQ